MNIQNFKYQKFYGIPLIKALKDTRCLNISDYFDDDNSSFIVSDRVRQNGVYIKFTEKRLGPWYFTFRIEHINKINGLKEKFNRVYIILVCGDIGTCCLNYLEFSKVINPLENSEKTISIYKKTGEKYTVKGTDGELKYKIGENDFPDKIFNPFGYEK